MALLFNADKFYAHAHMLDVCIKVVRRTWSDERKLKVRVSWYHRKGLKSMGLMELVTIQKKDFKYWSEIK